MKNVEIHANYLRQLVYDDRMSLIYYRMNEQIVDVFMNPLKKIIF